MKQALVFIALALACHSCKSGNANNYNNQNPNNTYNSCAGGCPNNDSDYSDSGITYRVKQALVTDGSLAAGSRFVSVSTTNGVVTLSGTVANSSEMSAIVRKVKGVNGVRSVNNQMTISNS